MRRSRDALAHASSSSCRRCSVSSNRVSQGSAPARRQVPRIKSRYPKAHGNNHGHRRSFSLKCRSSRSLQNRRRGRGKQTLMVTIQVQKLIDFVTEVFARAQSSPDEARRIATYLTTANLTGHDSHGVIRVPVYIRWQKSGAVVPNQNAELVLDTPSLAVIDGKFGYGQTVTPQAVRIGIEKCRKAGLAAVALRNAGHIGRVGDWAEMAAGEGLISVHFVNAAGSLLVAPFGGVEKRLSTAPYCVGI